MFLSLKVRVVVAAVVLKAMGLFTALGVGLEEHLRRGQFSEFT
jgi:hypothetical protein